MKILTSINALEDQDTVPVELFKKGQRQIVSILGAQDEGIRVRVVEESPVKPTRPNKRTQKGKVGSRNEDKSQGSQAGLDLYSKLNIDGAISTSRTSGDCGAQAYLMSWISDLPEEERLGRLQADRTPSRGSS